MARDYAIGLGAGTQVLTQMAGSFLISSPTELSVAFLMGAGWVINLAVAEWAIRRPRYGSRPFAQDGGIGTTTPLSRRQFQAK